MPRRAKDPSTLDLSQYGSLAEYNRKRHFGITPEPAGRKRANKAAALQFVIQKHAASHLHYDLRLEFTGVMKSWAVPKGPSLDPSVKRLAMAVEDHPIDYNQFEGVIPEGEYGAGTVMIWDVGTWMPEVPDVARALAKGELKFQLEGHKLRGSFTLVHTGDRRWLLIKHRDSHATAANDVVSTSPRSVVSRRSMKAIAIAARGTENQIERARAADPLAASVSRKPAEVRSSTTKRAAVGAGARSTPSTRLRRAARGRSR